MSDLIKSNLKYEQHEKDGKFFFILKSEEYSDKQAMLQDLTTIFSSIVKTQLWKVHELQNQLSQAHFDHPTKHEISIEDMKAALRWVQYKLGLYKDQFATSSCSREYMEFLEQLEFTLQCSIESLEKRGHNYEAAC